MSTVKDLAEILEVFKLVIAISFATLKFDVYFQPTLMFSDFSQWNLLDVMKPKILNFSISNITFILKQTFETDDKGLRSLKGALTFDNLHFLPDPHWFDEKNNQQQNCFEKSELLEVHFEFSAFKTKTSVSPTLSKTGNW